MSYHMSLPTHTSCYILFYHVLRCKVRILSNRIKRQFKTNIYLNRYKINIEVMIKHITFFRFDLNFESSSMRARTSLNHIACIIGISESNFLYAYISCSFAANNVKTSIFLGVLSTIALEMSTYCCFIFLNSLSTFMWTRGKRLLF